MSRWPIKPLGEVCNLVNGAPFKPSDWDGSGLPIIRIQNLNDSMKVFNYTSKKVPEKFRVKPGDTLLSWSGTPGTSFGCFRWTGPEGWLNQHIFNVRLNGNILPAFFIHQVNSKLDELIAKAHGGVGLQHITKGALSSVSMIVPPLTEQERIVKLLDEADELRKLRAQADQRTDALIPALFYEMFGDPILNPKGCKVVRLEEITTRITDGVHLKPNYIASGIPFISVKNITTGQLKFDNCKFISPEDHARFTKRCKPEHLDILYTKVGATYGRPALVDVKTEFSIYVSVCLIKPIRDVIDPHFLEIAMGTPAIKSQADRSIKGIGVPDLHLDQIQKFLMPLPPLNQQKIFASRVQEIRAMQTEQSASCNRLDDLFRSMLHRAFNGEL